VERESRWYDHHSDLAHLPLLESPWLGLYALLATWIERVSTRPECQGVVDLGSGPGLLGELLVARRYEHPYAGYDFSSRAITTAEIRDVVPVLPCDLRVRRERQLAYQRPGVLVFSEVLEHLEDDVEIVTDVPPGRYVIITGPSFDSDSHVRCYRSAAALRERYASLLQLHLAGSVDLSPPLGRKIYAISGWRL
jgi:trans-aconitate methyltransferase